MLRTTSHIPVSTMIEAGKSKQETFLGSMRSYFKNSLLPQPQREQLARLFEMQNFINASHIETLRNQHASARRKQAAYQALQNMPTTSDLINQLNK